MTSFELELSPKTAVGHQHQLVPIRKTMSLSEGEGGSEEGWAEGGKNMSDATPFSMMALKLELSTKITVSHQHQLVPIRKPMSLSEGEGGGEEG